MGSSEHVDGLTDCLIDLSVNMRNTFILIFAVIQVFHLSQVKAVHDGEGESLCPDHETSCILRHLLSQGLIRGKLPEEDNYYLEARANEYAVKEDIIKQGDTDVNNGDQRANRNSKYKSEC